MDHNHLRNNDEDRISNNNESTMKNQPVVVAALVETDVMERIERRLHDVQRRSEGARFKLQHSFRTDVFVRWNEDAVTLADEVHRFLLLGNPEQQQLQESTRNCDVVDDSITNIIEGGVDQWFQRSQDVSSSPSDWKRRLYFFEFCLALKCNHPNIHKVEISTECYWKAHVAFPDGRLRYLGSAMLKNTHITEFVVYVDMIRQEDDDVQRAMALLEFVRSSTVLRKVAIRKENNGTTTTRTEVASNHFAGLLLDAMATNALIHELDIAGSYPVDAFHRLMSTTSLRTLHIDCEDFNAIDDDAHRNQLLQALASNRSIEHLLFTVGDDGWVWMEEIQRHMSCGPAKVRKITVQQCTELPLSFDELTGMRSLQTLELDCVWALFSLQEQSWLWSVLARNNNIVNLKLIVGQEEDQKNINNILLHLHNGPSTLRKLTLKSYKYDFDGLQQYLCRTTALLQQLELEECFMEEDSVNYLVRGLQEREPSQSTVATNVTLKTCRLSNEAMNRLVEFTGARTKCHNQQYRQMIVSLLLSKESNLITMLHSPLEIKQGPYGIVHDVMNVSISSTLLSLAAVSSGISSYHPGSAQATAVSMRPDGRLPAYSDDLMAMVETSSVVCLQLSCVGSTDSTKMARWLPQLTNLCALHLEKLQGDVLPTTILNGLQGNGSLLTTSFLTKGRRPFFQDRRDKIVAQSYCQRNRFLAEMIVRKRAFINICSLAVETVLDNEGNADCLEDNSCTTSTSRLVLLPKLFRVVNAIPLFRSQFILVALTEFDATIIGPTRGQQ